MFKVNSESVAILPMPTIMQKKCQPFYKNLNL